jgi:hypothetical protein
MTAAKRWLVARALWEFALFDVVHSMLGLKWTLRLLGQTPRHRVIDRADEQRVCDAITRAACWYWKPVLCLQRSYCAVRMLRAHGIAAQFVIGYRPVPFFSHAWVEVDGRVVNDSLGYRQRLLVLYTA